MNHLKYTIDEVGTILQEASKVCCNSGLMQPAFTIELLYVDFFSNLVRWMPAPEDGNVFKAVRQLSEHFYNESYNAIRRGISQHSVDGSFIWALIYENQLILRQDYRRYNRQIPGKSPKGITKEIWHDYNHWLLAVRLWEGFINSLQPGFSVTIPSGTDGDIEKLLAWEMRPFWGMMEAYKGLGQPRYAGGNVGNAICVNPWEPLIEYRKKIKGAGKNFWHVRYTGH